MLNANFHKGMQGLKMDLSFSLGSQILNFYFLQALLFMATLFYTRALEQQTQSNLDMNQWLHIECV